MGADNTSTEEASPHQGRRGCTLSSEALPTETKRRLLKDSLAVVSRILYNCGWISCNSESKGKCVHVWVCASTLSISINLQLDFTAVASSSWTEMDCVPKPQLLEENFRAYVFLIMCENDKEGRGDICVRDFVYTVHMYAWLWSTICECGGLYVCAHIHSCVHEDE